MKSSKDLFLENLQQQAQLQSKLSTTRILPKQMDVFTTFVGNYPWQTVAVLSFLSAVVVYGLR